MISSAVARRTGLYPDGGLRGDLGVFRSAGSILQLRCESGDLAADFAGAGIGRPRVSYGPLSLPSYVVTELPKSHFARSADGTKIAYQVTGVGSRDLVVLGGGAIPTDLLWDDPGFIRLSKRLGTFSRTIWFELRGWGASEGNATDGLVGEIFDTDLCAVLDAMALERVVLFGWGYTSGKALHFSVTHPERVDALILFNSYAHYVREDDYPFGLPPLDVDAFMARFQEGWSTGETFDLLIPGRVADDRFRAWWNRSARLQLHSDQVTQIVRATMEMDLRPLLSSIAIPTLVLHRAENKYIEVGAGQYVAQHIPGAKFVALPGGDHHHFVGDTDGLADEIEDFLTGARSGSEADTVTATILFTDIVASTEEQVRLGPREWSRLTDQHEAMVRDVLAGHRGYEVKTTGDGFLMRFDGARRAIRCATEIMARAQGLGLRLRAGLHSGDVEVRGNDIGGLPVSIAKRVCDLAVPGEVLASDTVRMSTVGSGIQFEYRGEHELRGLPGSWRLFSVTG